MHIHWNLRNAVLDIFPDKAEKKLAVLAGIIYHRIRTCNWRIAWETTGEHGEEVIDRLGAFGHVQAVFCVVQD